MGPQGENDSVTSESLLTQEMPSSPLTPTNNLARHEAEVTDRKTRTNVHDDVTQRNAQELRELRAALATQRAALALAEAKARISAPGAFSTPTRRPNATLSARRSKSKTPSTRGSPSLRSPSMSPSYFPFNSPIEKSSGCIGVESYPPRWWKASGMLALTLLVASAGVMSGAPPPLTQRNILEEDHNSLQGGISHAADGDVVITSTLTSVQGTNISTSAETGIKTSADDDSAKADDSISSGAADLIAIMVPSLPRKSSLLQQTAHQLRRGAGSMFRVFAGAVLLPVVQILAGFLFFGFI